MLGNITKHVDKFFRRFFLAYIFVFIVSIVAFFILYNRSSAIIENQSIDRQMATLRQVRTRMDYNIAEIMTASIFASANPQVRSILHMSNPIEGTDIIRVKEAITALSHFHTATPLLVDFFVVYDYGNIVITPHIASHFYLFYYSNIHFDGMTAEAWRESIAEAGSFGRFVPTMHSSTVSRGQAEIIQYITPLTTPSGNKGAVVSFVSNRAIYEMFREIGISENETIFIIGSSGEIISTISGNTQIYDFNLPTGIEGSTRAERNGDTYLISYTTSAALGWTYVSVIRSDYVLAELNAFRHFLLLVVFAALGLTLVLSVIFSFQNTKPIKNLQETISGHMPILQHSFFNDLFQGKYYDPEEAMRNMKSIGITLTGNLYMVSVIQISAGDIGLEYLQNLARIPQIIDAYTELHKNSGIKFHLVSNRKAFVILFTYDGAAGPLNEYALNMANWLANRRDEIGEISIGVGNAFADISGIHRSYTEAMEAIQYYMVVDSSRTICLFSEIPHKQDFYYYPEQEKQRLLNMVKSGDTEGVRAALNAICSENFTHKKLSSNMMVAFINHLWQGIMEIDRLGIVIDQALTEKLTESYDIFYKLNDLQKLQLCTQLYLEICTSLHTYKKNKQDTLIETIKQYVDENYCDPEITLASLSHKHNFSETYLSQRFKEHTGENFNNYIQNLRISLAIELLKSSSLSIQVISERVGYSAYNTFAKAFKV